MDGFSNVSRPQAAPARGIPGILGKKRKHQDTNKDSKSGGPGGELPADASDCEIYPAMAQGRKLEARHSFVELHGNQESYQMQVTLKASSLSLTCAELGCGRYRTSLKDSQCLSS